MTTNITKKTNISGSYLGMTKLSAIIKILFLTIIVVGAYAFFSKTKIKDLCYQTMINLHIIKPCYAPEKDFVEVFKQEGFDYKLKDREITSSSLVKLQNLLSNKSSIPNISHHIYFGQIANPKALLEFYIQKMVANFSKLNDTANWKHYIWTNNPAIFPEYIKNYKNVVVGNLEIFKEHELYSYLQKTIHNGEVNRAYFMEASDILRMMALQKFGGLYQDIDYEIYDAVSLFELKEKFDFIGAREFASNYSYYGNSIILAKPDHPIINEALNRIKKYNIDQFKSLDYIKYPCNLYDELYFNSPPLLTISYFSKNNLLGNNDIILPSWMLLNVEFARFKNGDCQYSKVNSFASSNQNLSKLVEIFTSQVKNTISTNENNIYYSSKDKDNFKIIGADMFCGSWVDKKAKRNYYWNF